MKNKRKWIAGALVAASATLCITGSLAFFTDRADGTVFAKAGTMDMVFTDTSSSKTGANGITSNNEFAIDGTWDNSALVSDGMIINPGDFFDVSYNLSNAGNKSMDIRQKITITAEEPIFEDHYSNGKNHLIGGFYLTDANGNQVQVKESTENYTEPGDRGKPMTGIVSDDKKSITYELPDTTLCGVGTAAEDAGGGNLIWDFQTVSENNYKPHEDFVLASELTPAKKDLVGKTMTLSANGMEQSITLTDSAFEEIEGGLIAEGFIVIYEENVVYNGTIFEETGMYIIDFYAMGGMNGNITLPLGYDSELDNNYILHFAGKSGNEFQGKGVTVKLDIQAKQHHNTGEDTWVDWASYETTVEKVN